MSKHGGINIFLIMLAAYLDDSGSEKKGPVMVLAGFIARWMAWTVFSDEWQEALNRHPKLNYFKLREAERLEEQFGRLTPTQRDERVFEFSSIIARHVSMGIVASFRWEDFEITRMENRKLPLFPYDMLFFGLMSTVLTQLRKRVAPDIRVLFVFDIQGAAGRRSAETFESLISRLPPEDQRAVLGVSHLDDEEALPLQSADAIAWLMRRHAQQNPHAAPDLGDWKPGKRYLEPLGGIPRIHTYYPLERLRSLAARFKNVRSSFRKPRPRGPDRLPPI